MLLWRITSYPRALDVELSLRTAYVRLRVRYGRWWKRKAPADLVWMLRTGVSSEEACARVWALVVAEGDDTREFSSCGKATREGVQRDGVLVGHGAEDSAQLAEVMRINERHWAQVGRPVSAETVRKQLRIGATRARALTRAVREANRVAVDASSAAVIEKGQSPTGSNGLRLHHVTSTALS